jgi:hypothetical protein
MAQLLSAVVKCDGSSVASSPNLCVDQTASISKSARDNELITVSVQTMAGFLPPMTISAEATVRDLKLRLCTLNADLGCHRQKLLIRESSSEEAGGVVLLNHRTLRSYEITDNTNVALVMSPQPIVEVCLDGDLKDSTSFVALLANRDLTDVSIGVNSIDCHHALLLQLFETNRFIRSVQIRGRWDEEHLRFCESLVALRPEIDIRLWIERTDWELLRRVLRFCKTKRCSSITLRDMYVDHTCCVSLEPEMEWMSSF